MIKHKHRVRQGVSNRRQRVRERRTSLRASNSTRRRQRAALRPSGKLNRRRAAKPTPASAEEQRAQVQYVAAVKNFEAGVRYFQKHNYEKAKEVFAKLAGGSAHEVASRARVYLRMCEQKLGRTQSAPRTAADYYNLGVAQLNARNLDAAIEYLNKAERLAANQDHVRYALAAAHALLGNVEAALEHLKVALDLRPANRFLARRDDDLRPLAHDPRFQRLLHLESS